MKHELNIKEIIQYNMNLISIVLALPITLYSLFLTFAPFLFISLTNKRHIKGLQKLLCAALADRDIINTTTKFLFRSVHCSQSTYN